jgi:hypothetical protein
MQATLVSTTAKTTTFGKWFEAKEQAARDNFKNGKSSLTKIASGFYLMADENGMWKIHNQTTSNLTEDTGWHATYYPTGDSDPSDMWQFNTLKDFRQWIKKG